MSQNFEKLLNGGALGLLLGFYFKKYHIENLKASQITLDLISERDGLVMGQTLKGALQDVISVKAFYTWMNISTPWMFVYPYFNNFRADTFWEAYEKNNKGRELIYHFFLDAILFFGKDCAK